MAYDNVRGRTVLFGGRNWSGDPFQDTWEWTGNGWTNKRPSRSPPAQSDHTMAFDSSRSRVVMFGNNETWEWDGLIWTQVTTISSPVGSDYAMVYHSALGRCIVFGGRESGSYLQATWEYDASQDKQPAFQFLTAAGEAKIQANQLTGLRVRAHCGGTYAPYGRRDVGATLLGWSTGGPGLPPGSWQELAANNAAATSTLPHLPAPPAALIDWSSASADEAQSFFLERDASFNFQCRPSGVSGQGNATVALDYIEVRVRYRPQ
jgi:hypothetical protein